MTDKELLNEIADFLYECRDFLEECDEGLAGEVGMKDKIAGRIYKASQEITAAARLAKNEARKAE